MVEVELGFIYCGVIVLILVDIDDVAAEVDDEVDDEDWERLGNEVVAAAEVTEDPLEAADDPDDAIEKKGEKFVWVGSESSEISIV